MPLLTLEPVGPTGLAMPSTVFRPKGSAGEFKYTGVMITPSSTAAGSPSPPFAHWSVTAAVQSAMQFALTLAVHVVRAWTEQRIWQPTFASTEHVEWHVAAQRLSHVDAEFAAQSCPQF